MCINCFWNWLSNNASNVIAICALGTTFYQAHLTRNHNRLSVKPHLTTWHESMSDGQEVFEIINNGVGPALIKEFKIFVDGQEVTGEGVDIVSNCLKIIFSAYKLSIINSGYLGNGYVMSAKEHRTLITFAFEENNEPSDAEFEFLTNRVRLLVKYESIYGVPDTYDSDLERKKSI